MRAITSNSSKSLLWEVVPNAIYALVQSSQQEGSHYYLPHLSIRKADAQLIKWHRPKFNPRSNDRAHVLAHYATLPPRWYQHGWSRSLRPGGMDQEVIANTHPGGRLLCPLQLNPLNVQEGAPCLS